MMSTSKSRKLLQCLQSYMGFPTGLREPVEQQILDSNTTGRPARYPPALPPQSPKPEESHAPSHVGAGCFECSGTSGVSSWIRDFWVLYGSFLAGCWDCVFFEPLSWYTYMDS